MQTRLPLSVAIITLNEEARLGRCLASVSELASEIVVVDSGSTDGTESVARQFGARFVVEPWQGHVAQKNRAWAACSQPWVLGLDADEAVSPELAMSLRGLFGSGPPVADGYWIKRRTFYLGRWINHAWYPDWKLRLARREKARWAGADLHERLEVQGRTACLEGDLLHYSYRDLEDHFQRALRYARISGQSLARRGKRCRWYHVVLSPWFAFGKKLILKQGFRDGTRGWIIAYATLFGVLAKYAFLFERHELMQQETPRDDGARPEPAHQQRPANSAQ